MKANLGSLSLFWLLFFGFNLNPEHIITLSELSEGEKSQRKKVNENKTKKRKESQQTTKPRIKFHKTVNVKKNPSF